MKEGHAFLTEAGPGQLAWNLFTPELVAHYAPDGGDLDRRVESFLQSFEPLLNGERLPEDTLNTLGQEAFGALLRDLDAAVHLYEYAAKKQIADAEALHFLLVGLTILLLIGEGVLVFRPLALKAEGQVALAKSALEERSKLLSQSLSVARMGYWVLEFEDRAKIWMSQEIADLYGVPHYGDQWIPTEVLLDMIEHEKDSVSDALTNCARTRNTQRVRSSVRTPDGRALYLSTLIIPRFGDNGAVIGVNGVARDVTVDVKQKKDLERRTNELAEAQALGKMAIWRVDLNDPDMIIEAEDDFYELIGHTPRSFPLTQENIFKLHAHPEISIPKVEQLFKDIHETGEGSETDIDLIRQDGEIASIRMRQKLEFDENGRPKSVFGTIQCITTQKKMERQLLVRDQQLSEAQVLGNIAMWRREIDAETFELGEDYYALLRYEKGAFEPTDEGLKSIQLDYLRDQTSIAIARQKSVDTRQVQTFESTVRRGDGTVADLLVRQKVETDEDGEIVARFGTIQDITDRRQSERQLEQLAYFDHLTGLGNRAMFSRRLKALAEASPEEERLSALLLLDLDNFKEVNDGLGHDAGDEFLCEVAQRLTRVAGPNAFAARLGGDEFAILLKGMRSRAEISTIAQEVVSTLSLPARLKAGEVIGGASVGVSVLPVDSQDPDEAMRFADLALYHAKDGGRNCSVFFSPSMSEVMLERLSLARNLRGAADRGELTTHFQPIVSGDTMDVIGFEALLRWNCRERGMIPPSQFIPIAESSHVISTLGEFVFMDACMTLRSWIDAGLAPREISINVSAAQLWNSDLEMMIDQALAETRIPPELICIELTESVFVGDALSRIEGLLNRLKARGLKLALDDFGTGYSSLGYLNRLPFDKLKIDRCFISDADISEEKQELLRGIVGLARGLGMKTVAEGVETQGELDIVRKLHCDQIQGFYFGKPKAAEHAVVGAAEIKAKHQLAGFRTQPLPPKERRAVRGP